MWLKDLWTSKNKSFIQIVVCYLSTMARVYTLHISLDYKSLQITNETKNDQNVLYAGQVFFFDTL